MTETPTNKRGRRNEVMGYVVSDKMDKTISVRIYRSKKHPKYHKFIKRSSIYKAHDELNVAKEGDRVRIFESRPLSKTKRWKLAFVVDANGVEVSK